nr:MAG TPA: hypothetical protein [Caudoviricetes sp.]
MASTSSTSASLNSVAGRTSWVTPSASWLIALWETPVSTARRRWEMPSSLRRFSTRMPSSDGCMTITP